jgi:transcriptional regulator with XRE-family HTH domain
VCDDDAEVGLEPTAEQLGRHLRELRRGLGLGVDELADRAGVEPAVVYAVEAGELEPDLAVLMSLSRGLGMTLGTIFRLLELRQGRR